MSRTSSQQSSANESANGTPTPVPKKKFPLADLKPNQIMKIVATVVISLFFVAILVQTAIDCGLKTGSLSNDQFKSKANRISIYLFTLIISGLSAYYYFK